MDSLVFLFIPLLIVAFVALAIYSSIAEKKRREALALEASRLGLLLEVGRNTEVSNRFAFLNKLHTGDNRYAENVIRGTFSNYAVCCFDYHYETYSTDSKGNRTTDHHWHSLYTLMLPKSFPELTIGPENLFTRAAKVFGYGSIDFESAEFSKAFLVRSPDKKFAYDVCHPQMMGYLLQNRDLTLEVDENVYALIFGGKSKPSTLSGNLDRLVKLRELLPGYLFDS